MTRKRIILVGLALAVVMQSVSVFASDTDIRQKIFELTVAPKLRGLQGVYVEIEDLSPEVVKDGLTKEQIQTDVEVKLRMAGIKIIPTLEEWLKATGKPTLYINVNALKVKGGLFAFCITVELQQAALLERDMTVKAIATTWSSGRVVAMGVAHLQDIRGDVKDLVDKFINDYLAANPKK